MNDARRTRLDRADHQRLALSVECRVSCRRLCRQWVAVLTQKATTKRGRRIHAWMLHMSTSQRPR